MAVKNKAVKDKTGIDFNPITGKLDLVRKFNVDRIVTNERNSAGTLLMTYDPASGLHIPADAQVVTDNEGNLITVGGA